MRRFRKILNILPIFTLLATNVSLNSRCLANEPQETPQELEAVARGDVERCSKQLGENNKETSEAKLVLAILLKNQGRDAEAERVIRPALASFEKSCGPDSLEVANAQDHLGRILRHLHRLSESEFYQRKSLAILEKLLPANDSKIVNALIDLAKVLSESPGKMRAAKEVYLRALRIAKDNGDAKQTNYVTENLASCLLELSEPKEAREYMTNVLKDAAADVKGRPDTYAIVLANIGKSYVLEKQDEDAYKYFIQALAVIEQAKTPSHKNLAIVLSDMGDINMRRGLYGIASQQFARALAIRHDRPSDFFDKNSETQSFKFVEFYEKRCRELKIVPNHGLTKIGSENQQPTSLTSVSLSILAEIEILKKHRKNGDFNATDLANLYRERRAKLSEKNPLTIETRLQLARMLSGSGARETKCVVMEAEVGLTTFATKLLKSNSTFSAEEKGTIQFLGGRDGAAKFAEDELIWLSYVNGQNGENELSKQNLELAENLLSAQKSHDNYPLSSKFTDSDAERMLTMAEAWRQLADFQRAEKLSENALKMAEQLKSNDLKYKSLLQLATLDLGESDLEPALKHAKEARTIASATFGETAPEIIPCDRILAEICLDNGTYTEARNYAFNALHCHGVSGSDTVFMHNMQGFAYLCEGTMKSPKLNSR